MERELNNLIEDVTERVTRKRLQSLTLDATLVESIAKSKEYGSFSEDFSLSVQKTVKPVSVDLKDQIGQGNHGPKFDPPYDSPLEEEFAYNIVKYLGEEVEFQKQVTIDTLCGRFRLDFTAQRAGRCIGLECDGEEYHDERRDYWRDAMLLETGLVHAIYRFRGKDLYYYMEDCLFILSICEPQLFLGRGLVCLKSLSSYEAKSSACCDGIEESSRIFVGYENFRFEHGILIKKHAITPVAGEADFLMERSRFAKQFGGGNLDDLIEKFEERRVVFKSL